MESVILSGPEGCRIRKRFASPPGPELIPPDVYDVVPSTTTEPIDPVLEAHYYWRRNAPFLYKSVLVHGLEWPSFTIDFYSDATYRPNARCLTAKMLLGTQTSGADVEYAIVAEVKLGVVGLSEDLAACENFVGFTASKRHESVHANTPCFDVKAKLVHPGEVNRIVHCPKSQFIFATGTGTGNVLVFDYAKHPCMPRDPSVSLPQLVLTNGHTDSSCGLCWTSGDSVASCADDGSVCFWDVSAQPRTTSTSGTSDNGGGDGGSVYQGISPNSTSIEPLLKVKGAECQLNDVKCMYPNTSNAVICAAEDGTCKGFDPRIAADGPNVQLGKSHKGPAINCLDVNVHCNWYVVTGNVDGHVELWDIRQTSNSVCTLGRHQGAVNAVSFFSECAGLVTSASNDSKLAIWDLTMDGKDKLRFLHAGHMGQVSDLGVLQSLGHLTFPCIASTSSDNFINVFVPILSM